MNAQVWIPLVFGIGIQAVGALFQLWVFKKLNKDEQVEALQKDVNALRGSVKYIEGRLNGRHWKTE
jgi:hypothetical protein